MGIAQFSMRLTEVCMYTYMYIHIYSIGIVQARSIRILRNAFGPLHGHKYCWQSHFRHLLTHDETSTAQSKLLLIAC